MGELSRELGVPWTWAGSHLCDSGKAGLSEQLCPPLGCGGDNTHSYSRATLFGTE